MVKDHLIATFADGTALVEAVTSIRARGFKVYDVYTPFPVHGLDEAMGLRRSRLGLVTLVGAIAGLAAALRQCRTPSTSNAARLRTCRW